MLLQFSVSNFRSFKDEQFITMIPAKIKGHEENIAHVAPGLDVLKSAVIYGANASGKSNFIRAIGVLRDMIETSAVKTPSEQFEDYSPFLLSKAKQSIINTEMKIDVLINDIQYHYEISFDKSKIIAEKLTFYPNGKEAKLFEKKGENVTFGEYFRGPKKLLEFITAPNQLLLSKGAINNVDELVKVYKFFTSYLLAPTQFGHGYDTGLSVGTAYLLKNRGLSFARNVMKLFTVLDTGITKFEVFDNKPNSVFEPTKNNYEALNDKFEIKTYHTLEGQEEVAFDIRDESLGTQKLFGLCGLICIALEKNSVLVFDELERSLHPNISRFIINLFNNPKINKKNAQLIVSTHDTNLLSEENKLRRDQIWIVEKNEQGASQMISLADMKGIRDNVPFEKWYLSGRFGGVPNIESLQFEFDFSEDEKTENHSNGAH